MPLCAALLTPFSTELEVARGNQSSLGLKVSIFHSVNLCSSSEQNQSPQSSSPQLLILAEDFGWCQEAVAGGMRP